MHKNIICCGIFVGCFFGYAKNIDAYECGSFTTPCISGGTANTFVPSIGTLSAYEKNGHRLVEVTFLWDNEYRLSYLQADHDHTLEPDAEFWGPNHYAQRIALSYDFDLGRMFPDEPTVITSTQSSGNIDYVYPFPYADAVIDDDDPRFVTVGSVHAFLFHHEVVYRTISRTTTSYTGNTDFGPIALRFQRGKWVFYPEILDIEDYIGLVCGVDIDPINPVNPLIPNYPLAPLCVFSCCDELPSAHYVVARQDKVYPPACRAWGFDYFSSSGITEKCIESDCSDGEDNDVDFLTDCEDPDCAGSPDCITVIEPPTDPCSTVTSGNGYYCGSNEELTGYVGDDNDLVYCQNGMTVYVETCAEGCQQNLPGYDDECIDTSCTPICSPGQTQCNGNDVEVCSADQCSYEFYYSCDADQTCSNGTCITTTAPPPVINSVSCTSYYRGDTNVTCTVYGSNFDCSAGSNAYIANFYNGPAQTCSSTQFTVSGDWVCNQELGFKQVSYRNSDNQRDDRTNLLELLMGDLFITNAWQQTVHEGATNVPMGANGCNFGENVVLFVEGVAITNTHLNAEDQVLGDGEVTWPAGSPASMLCVAKYSGASIGPDKECLYNYVTIVP